MGTARHLAAWVAAIVFFVLGAIWYSVLSAQWLAAIGKTTEQMAAEQAGSPIPFVIGFVAILVMCYALAWLIERLQANSLAGGMGLGAAVALGFIAANLALNYGFERRSITLGTRQDGSYEVMDGLRPGDRVVTEGGLFLQFAESQ